MSGEFKNRTDPALPELTLHLSPEEEAEVLERRVGPYELLEEVGRGGMGSVWLARRADDQYQKRVAIKLIKGGLDSAHIVERFRAERQILAGLDHPNIARLLDGDTTSDGRPYFVMEHVDGTPITRYCDETRLSTSERLRLFRGVCAAVHYAHQRLIIHRDIKPANVLVTRDAVAKLLDFGIAKITTPAASDPAAATALVDRPMTPAYASPEQIRGEPMTTASDTYSLGVLLYELLTGHWPYEVETRNLMEIQKAVCEQEPLRPSSVVTRPLKIFALDGATGSIAAEVVSGNRDGHPEKLKRRLSGDLDNVVLRAMAKEPDRRYASVEQFSEDILRHLEGRPVLARRPTLRYRASKFATRNKALVAAGTLALLALVAGVAGVAWQARVAGAERAKAERRFNDVRKLANSFMFELHDAIRDLPGATPARALLVKRALAYLDGLAGEAAGDASLQRELAAAYLRLGDVQGKPYEPNLGDSDGALASYRKSAGIGEALLAGGHAEARRDLADAYSRIGDGLAIQGDVAAAVESHRKALGLRRTLVAEAPGDATLVRDLAYSHGRLGDRLADMGEMGATLESRRQALELLRRLSADHPEDRDLRQRFANALQKLGNNLGNPQFPNAGNTEGALENLNAAGAIFRELLAAEPTSAKLRRVVAVNLSNVADVLLGKKDHAGAVERAEASLAAFESLARADPSDAQARADVAIGHTKIGEIRAEARDWTGAESSYRQALAIHASLSKADPSNAREREEVGLLLNRVGKALIARGDRSGGLALQQQAQAIYAALAKANPQNQELRLSAAGALSAVGEAHASLAAASQAPEARREEWSRAMASYAEALATLVDLRAKGALTGSDAGEVDRVAGLRAEAQRALAALTR